MPLLPFRRPTLRSPQPTLPPSLRPASAALAKASNAPSTAPQTESSRLGSLLQLLAIARPEKARLVVHVTARWAEQLLKEVV